MSKKKKYDEQGKVYFFENDGKGNFKRKEYYGQLK